jgi:hypothetical protein
VALIRSSSSRCYRVIDLLVSDRLSPDLRPSVSSLDRRCGVACSRPEGDRARTCHTGSRIRCVVEYGMSEISMSEKMDKKIG